ncbi:MAG: iron-containing alcohol dehydrogenase [Planctomycetes bacterium]|nr:iron-containing alcohol dehydrogenase [Planctomycetota bacterium]
MKLFEMGPLDYSLPTQIAFGWGRTAEAADLAASLGRRALLVTMKDLSAGPRIADILRKGGIEVEVFDGAESDPSIEGIDAAALRVREGGFDFLVAVGGGSVIDTAKALCLLARGRGSAWDYTIEMGDDRRMGASDTPPLLAIPTTSGTGSEVTCIAVMTNKGLSKKAPIRDPIIFPRIALVDPELASTMPPKLTASTGFDAFTHAYERFFGGALSMLVHVLATTGMRTVVENLETAVNEPDNRAARTAMSWAATQCAMALAPPGGEACLHVFGLPLGAVAHVPHGQALAAVMRVITRESLRRMPKRRPELATIMGLPEESSDEEILDCIEAWLKRIGLPTRMSGHDVTEHRISCLMAAISRDRITKALGEEFGEDDIKRLYLDAL